MRGAEYAAFVQIHESILDPVEGRPGMRAAVDIAENALALSHDEEVFAAILRVETAALAVRYIVEPAEPPVHASVSPIRQINAQASLSIGITDRRDCRINARS